MVIQKIPLEVASTMDFTSHDFVPGTVHLVAVAQSTGTGNVVLHPQPSRDREDPLNWSYRRKLLATSCMFA